MAKISIIGAGQVGSETAFALANSALAREIVLVDINSARSIAAAKDIAHAAALQPPVQLHAEEYPGIADSDIVVFTAGAAQKPEEKRGDLFERNRAVIEAGCREIRKYAPNCILIVVTNPTDALTRYAVESCGFPRESVIGSGTYLDSLRFRAMIADHANVDARDVQAWVLGEHGDSEVPAWESVRIGGMTAEDFAPDADLMERLRADFDCDVRDAAYEIIRGKGATACGIANAIVRIVEAILRDEHSVITVSTYLNGEYGIYGTALSLPCVIGRNGVEQVLEAQLSPEETDALRKSADAVKMMQTV